MTAPRSEPADAQPTLLRRAFVFDAATRTFVPGRDILLEGGRVARVGEDIDAPGARVVDCGGLYAIPGLIDCHVHITSSGEPGAMNYAAREPLPLRAWRAGEYARRTLHAGFTTVRDLGAADRLNVDLARAIDEGLVEGPRVLAAGLGVTMTGGHGHGFIAREADGPDEVRKAVREQLRAGATTVKLFASGGVMTPGVDPRSPSLTEEELRAGVEEAHKAFRVVGAHAQSTEGIKNAVRAGVDSIEHGVWLDGEAIELMAERGTYLVATLTAPYHIAHGGLEAGIPPFMVDKAHQVLEDHFASFKAAVAGGVRVAMGTDQGTPLSRPGENAQEIVRIAEQGLSNAGALLAATAWAADLLNIEAGRLEAGKAADIVILRGDPLADISILTDQSCIAGVIKAGRDVRLEIAGTASGGTT
ncbi:MAG: amidohydrolase family protein [Dehalococcoidia bacterium]|nr:amidohydrolase family protein [Dehalococcoidia bacterium]